MPNTREKLIELLACAEDSLLEQAVAWDDEQKEEHISDGDGYGFYADHLIANGVTVQEWISVKDRLPEKDGYYLVFEKHTYGTYTAVLRFAKDARKVDKYDFHRGWKNVWYRYDSEWGHITIDSVTHWMPLPQPPKGE